MLALALRAIAIVLGVSAISYLLGSLKLRTWIYLVCGIALCFSSSLLYSTGWVLLLSASSFLLSLVLGFAAISGFRLAALLLKREGPLWEAVIPGATVATLFSLNLGSELSYSVVYPVLAQLGYTGLLYTALGYLGMYVQALLVSLSVSCFALAFSNLAKP